MSGVWGKWRELQEAVSMCDIECEKYIIKIKLYLCVQCTHVCIAVYMWRSEDNMQKSILSVHRVAAGIKLGSSGLAASTFTSSPIWTGQEYF